MALLLLTFLLIGSTWAGIRPNPSQGYNSPAVLGRPNGNDLGGFGESPHHQLTSQQFGNGPTNSFGTSSGPSLNGVSTSFGRVSQGGYPNTSPSPPSEVYNEPTRGFNGPSTVTPRNPQNGYGLPQNNQDFSLERPTSRGSYNGGSSAGNRHEFSSGIQNGLSASGHRNSNDFTHGSQQGFSSDVHGPLGFSSTGANSGGFSGNSQSGHNGRLSNGASPLTPVLSDVFNSGIPTTPSTGYSGPTSTPRLKQGVVQGGSNGGLFRGQAAGNSASGFGSGRSSNSLRNDNRPLQTEATGGAFKNGSSGVSRPSQGLRAIGQTPAISQIATQRAIGGAYNGGSSRTARLLVEPTTNHQSSSAFTQGAPQRIAGGSYNGDSSGTQRPSQAFPTNVQSGLAYSQSRQQGSFGASNGGSLNRGVSSAFTNGAQGGLNDHSFGHSNKGSNSGSSVFPQQTSSGSFGRNIFAGNQGGNSNVLKSTASQSIVFHSLSKNRGQNTGNSRVASGINGSPTFGQGNIGTYNTQRPSNFDQPSARPFPSKNNHNGFNRPSGSYNAPSTSTSDFSSVFNGSSSGFSGPAGAHGANNGLSANGHLATGGFANSREDFNGVSSNSYGK